MKEFVVGSPFTTSIDLLDEDEFLVVACDGVCISGYLADISIAMGRGQRSKCR